MAAGVITLIARKNFLIASGAKSRAGVGEGEEKKNHGFALNLQSRQQLWSPIMYM